MNRPKPMCPKTKDQGIDVKLMGEDGEHFQASIEGALRLKIEALCLDELKRSSDHLSKDKYQRIEEVLLRIAGRITEPLLTQTQEVNGGRNRRAHNLRMIAEAFDL